MRFARRSQNQGQACDFCDFRFARFTGSFPTFDKYPAIKLLGYFHSSAPRIDPVAIRSWY